MTNQPKTLAEQNKPIRRTYLGDSVYMDQLPYGFEIYTQNDTYRENVIFLEPEVLSALIRFTTQKPD